MAACKYVVRNGQKIPVDLANCITRLKAEGYTNAQIAEKLKLSEAQVINYSGKE